MVPAHLVVRLSPTAVLVAFSSFTNSVAAHALPRQTTTVAFHQLNVLPWPLQPTAAPEAFDGDFLLRRQLNTVCGYVGGDPDLPATCSAGSHCVVDVELGAIGCCPDGGTCTQGVFTSCVDGQSDPQNEVNPYVYTCKGDDLCYKNNFEGGFFQYGCGSTSGIQTNVAATASGQSAIQLTSVTAPLTAPVETLSEPTTLGTQSRTRSSTRTSADSSTTSSSSTRSSSSETSTSRTSSRTSSTDTSTISTATETSESTEASETATNTASESASSTESDDESATTTGASAPDTDESNTGTNTGAIIGGTISGVAALVAFAVLGLWLWRRKKGNTRQGPGMKQQAQQVGPVSQNRHAFSPLPEGDEAHFPPPVAHRAITPPERSDFRPEPYQPNYPYGYTATATAGDGEAVGAGSQMEHDQVPLTRELDEFSNNFNSALGRISEEEPRPGTAITSPMAQTYTPPRSGGGGALWQQNRGASWL